MLETYYDQHHPRLTCISARLYFVGSGSNQSKLVVKFWLVCLEEMSGNLDVVSILSIESLEAYICDTSYSSYHRHCRVYYFLIH